MRVTSSTNKHFINVTGFEERIEGGIQDFGRLAEGNRFLGDGEE